MTDCEHQLISIENLKKKLNYLEELEPKLNISPLDLKFKCKLYSYFGNLNEAK